MRVSVGRQIPGCSGGGGQSQMIQKDFYLGKPGFSAVGVPGEAGGHEPAGPPPPPSAPRYLRAAGAAEEPHPPCPAPSRTAPAPIKIEKKKPSRKPKANPQFPPERSGLQRMRADGRNVPHLRSPAGVYPGESLQGTVVLGVQLCPPPSPYPTHSPLPR